METTLIKTVDELVETLKEDCDRCRLDIMKAIDIPHEEFEKYYTWNDEHYTRNCLAKTDNFELLLVCWEKGQSSVIHDFDSSEAWIHVISGKLTEERFQLKDNKLDKVSSVVLDPSGFSYMGGSISIHRYTNTYGARTVSLSLFGSPIEKWNEYDEETGAIEQKVVSRDMMYELTSVEK